MTSRIYRSFLFGSILLFLSCQGQQLSEQAGAVTLNNLSKSNNPYLLEHADNPVNWYEWGEEALAKAKKENKPLIISIGYASCHWCHVMEEESFMDTTVARIMNEHFISIKIDREERPDIDQVYINAAQILSGGAAGWPLNAFALPDGRPFYAATYFPKEQWIRLLGQVNEAFAKEHDKLVAQADALTKGIREQDIITAPADNTRSLNKKTYQRAFSTLTSYVDFESGGLIGAPKFPMPADWEFLLQYHYITGDKKALDAVTVTLDAMASGGIFDQIGGGFARYSTDQAWKVPHFEKMMYDNGQLVSLYSHAYQVTQNPLYREVIVKTLAFIKKEMTSGEGGFYASINADSEGEEGKFYTWTKTEIRNILKEKQAELISDYFQVTDSGNWEGGKNILFHQNNAEDFVRQNSLSLDEFRNMLTEAGSALLRERDKRVHPSVDDKILTSWNALMLKGYVDAYVAIGDEAYLQSAVKNAKFIESKMMRRGGGLWRGYKEGKAVVPAFLDDYALLAKAFLRLYEVTFDIRWLEHSRTLADFAIAHFFDKKSGLFFYASDQAENLVARKMEIADNVIPSSNSIMADVLFRLAEYFDQPTYAETSNTMLTQVEKDLASQAPYYANWNCLLGIVNHQPYEIAIMGDDAIRLSLELQKRYLPVAIFMGGNQENIPLLRNKLMAGENIIYVCRNKVCKLPVKNVPQALLQLK